VLEENHSITRSSFYKDQLRRLRREYVGYDNADRVHTELQVSPMGRSTKSRLSPKAQVVGIPRVGGLHHRYAWQAAA
jgi:hypothetical protein